MFNKFGNYLQVKKLFYILIQNAKLDNIIQDIILLTLNIIL